MGGGLAALSDLDGRHIGVLGEMAELGPVADAAHREVGTLAGQTLDLLVAVGEAGGALADAALAAGLDPAALVRVGDAEEAAATLEPMLRPGDVVLVKASRSVGLEQVVAGLVERRGGAAA
jgi:UDP-N-acetylmuramoyl-tripeptide--D-alanyl-D-alanine ligase